MAASHVTGAEKLGLFSEDDSPISLSPSYFISLLS